MAATPSPELQTRPALRRPEHRLLLLCARTRVGGEAAESLKRLAASTLDWDYLYLLARRHALLPLLYWQLNATAAGEVPPAQLGRLRDEFRLHTARNLYLTGELERVVTLFEAEGVPVVPYKGPSLAAYAYGNLTLRRYVDLDVLVHMEDVARAKELLARRGFQPRLRLTPAQERVLLRSQHNLPFTREDGLLLVELHWELAQRRYASAASEESLWSRLVDVKLGGREVKGLSAEDLLLSLCVHGTKHLWERLAWVCDVSELLNARPQLDWPFVLRQARETRTERMLLLGLRLARELLDARVPAEVRARADAEPSVESLAGQVTARLFDGVEHRPAGLLEQVGFNLRARPGLAERLRYFSFIFTPTDADLAALALPSNLSFLYYFLRPFRLLLKGDQGH
jgi:Uncharacterised nucleotidyltransferase